MQCGAKGGKDGFLRIAGRTGTGWEPDPESRRDGRGFYLCRDAGCIERFARRIRTPKGARRLRIGAHAAILADALEKWRGGCEHRLVSAGDVGDHEGEA